MELANLYAAAVVRLRWLFFTGWILAAIGLSLSLPTLDETGGSGGLQGLATPDNPAIQAEIRSFEKFGFPVLSRTAVVQRNSEGLPAATQVRVVSNAIEFNLTGPRSCGASSSPSPSSTASLRCPRASTGRQPSPTCSSDPT